MPLAHWDECADLALTRIRASGAEYGDIRIQHGVTQLIEGEDRRIARIDEQADSGFGVRVLYRGGWGFAASSILSFEDIPRVADLAIAMAKQASLMVRPIRLVEEPVHVDHVRTPRCIDPFDVPIEEKTCLLSDIMEYLHGQPRIVRSRATLWARQDRKLFVSTEGTHLVFDLLAVQGGCEATAAHHGLFASRRFSTPHLRTGYELIRNTDFLSEASRIAAQAIEKVNAPPVEAGTYDLVLDPEHLVLTIHETCGHPSELDRALGYEANYAGTSFLTPELRGTFRYGSPCVTLVADNTEPETLAATGYDDDGVACQRWDIVRDGRFVGYCTNRELASLIGDTRSRGSNRAQSWAHIPMIRIANIGLEPGPYHLDQLIGGTTRGIYIEGHGSYSIDQ
ncbi:MAG: TldD/PmbA family protein, partial [Nitrospirae bacterium]